MLVCDVSSDAGEASGSRAEGLQQSGGAGVRRGAHLEHFGFMFEPVAFLENEKRQALFGRLRGEEAHTRTARLLHLLMQHGSLALRLRDLPLEQAALRRLLGPHSHQQLLVRPRRPQQPVELLHTHTPRGGELAVAPHGVFSKVRVPHHRVLRGRQRIVVGDRPHVQGPAQAAPASARNARLRPHWPLRPLRCATACRLRRRAPPRCATIGWCRCQCR